MASRLDRLPAAAVRRAGEAAARHLGRSVELAGCRSVILYASLPDELPSPPLLSLARSRGKPTCFPRMTAEGVLTMVACEQWEDLSAGRYGVLEPPSGWPGRPLQEGDLVLVPGVAFDRSGHRLGRGGGYWDRTIPAGRPEGLMLIGVSFACQQIERVPHGPGDRGVDALLSEAGFHRVAVGGAA